MKRYYIGLAATIHDAALAIVDPSGTPVFAEATERYLQCKRAYNCTADDPIRIPQLIHEHCEPDAELYAAVSWSTSYLNQLNFLSAWPSYSTHSKEDLEELSWPLPAPESLIVALRNSVSQASVNLLSTRQIPNRVRLQRYDHHLTHAANAAYTSSFEECVIAVIDGFGETGSTGFFRYENSQVSPLTVAMNGRTPNQQAASLGFFYSRLCALCGFDPIKGEEWKVMGLAPYGVHESSIYELLRPMLQVSGLTLTSGCSDPEIIARMKTLKSMMRRPESSPLESANLAYTGQEVFEDVMSELLNNLWKRGISDNLAYSGGCALNSSYNGRILSRVPFKHLHIPSAPADDGNALGSAFLAYVEDQAEPRMPTFSQTPYLGSRVTNDALERLVEFGNFGKLVHAPSDLQDRVAVLLAQGKIIGWVQGQAEFGPRSLGNRSILGDPRAHDMKERINARVKFREEFRPFAPSILEEFGPEYFEDYQFSPYMERTLRFRQQVRERVPAVVHKDGTGRLQSVRRQFSPRFYDLIAAFHKLTGVPLLLNTSFNIMGKPIIHSVEDALGMFLTTGIDALALEDYLIEK